MDHNKNLVYWPGLYDRFNVTVNLAQKKTRFAWRDSVILIGIWNIIFYKIWKYYNIAVKYTNLRLWLVRMRSRFKQRILFGRSGSSSIVLCRLTFDWIFKFIVRLNSSKVKCKKRIQSPITTTKTFPMGIVG